MVGVGVDEGCALLEPVDTTADGLVGIGTAGDVPEVGVLVGDQWGFEFGLDFGEVLEC